MVIGMSEPDRARWDLRRCRACGDEFKEKAHSLGAGYDCNKCGASGRNIVTVEKDVEPPDYATDGGTAQADSDRVECWRCGYMRLTFESCPQCGGSCKPLTKEKQQADPDYKREHLHTDGGVDESDSGQECQTISCNRDSEITVEYGNERHTFQRKYCEPHARYEVGKHPDARYLDADSCENDKLRADGGVEKTDSEQIDWVTFSVREGQSGHRVRRDDPRDVHDGGLPQTWEYFRGDKSAMSAYIHASERAAEICAEGRLAVVIPLGARRRDLELPSVTEERYLHTEADNDV